MTTINIDDLLINEVIAVSHHQDAQEAVVKILAEYVAQKKKPILLNYWQCPTPLRLILTRHA